MNKKLMSMVVIGALTMGLMVGCGSDEEKSVDNSNNKTQEQYEDKTKDNNNEDNNTQNNTQEDNTNDNNEESEESAKDDIDSTYDNNKSDIEEARQLLEPAIDDNFTGIKHELKEQDGTLILYVQFSYDELMNTTESDWNTLVENSSYCVSVWRDKLDSMGNSTGFAIIVGDMDIDRAYLVVNTDGDVVYNVADDINAENDSVIE